MTRNNNLATQVVNPHNTHVEFKVKSTYHNTPFLHQSVSPFSLFLYFLFELDDLDIKTTQVVCTHHDS